MARKTHSLPRGTYYVVMSAHCGMAYVVSDREIDAQEARAVVRRYAERRQRRGYAISQLDDVEWQHVELTEPEDAMMVPDDAGILSILEETDPAVECFECGSLVRIGESCDCQDVTEDDEDQIVRS